MISEVPFFSAIFSKISPILLANIHLSDGAVSRLEFPTAGAYKR